jgi:hypothetical protein
MKALATEELVKNHNIGAATYNVHLSYNIAIDSDWRGPPTAVCAVVCFTEWQQAGRRRKCNAGKLVKKQSKSSVPAIKSLATEVLATYRAKLGKAAEPKAS